jgi:hypothetical protein
MVSHKLTLDKGKSLIDYTFHICITRWAEHQSQIVHDADPRQELVFGLLGQLG